MHIISALVTLTLIVLWYGWPHAHATESFCNFQGTFPGLDDKHVPLLLFLFLGLNLGPARRNHSLYLCIICSSIHMRIKSWLDSNRRRGRGKGWERGSSNVKDHLLSTLYYIVRLHFVVEIGWHTEHKEVNFKFYSTGQDLMLYFSDLTLCFLLLRLG